MRRVGFTLRVDAVRERRDAIDQAWYGVAAAAGLVPVLLPNLPDPRRVAGLIAELGLAGVVLTGGNDLAHLPGATEAAPERDAVEREVLAVCGARGLPVLGVCRGMQHLIAYHGGKLQRVAGHVARPHPLHVAVAGPIPIASRAAVNSFHGWGATPADLPAALRVAATSDDGTVEAVAHATLPQWGLMWHPERGVCDPADVVVLRRLFGAAGGEDAP